MTRIKIEEKTDEHGEYKPYHFSDIINMIKETPDRLTIIVPNACGGETRVTIFKEL